jgi:hypothetical protein
LRRPNIVAFCALTVLAALAVLSQADALQSNRAYKTVVLTVVVTPSPAPVVFFNNARPAVSTASTASSAAALLADPFSGPVQIAASGSAWDVPPGAGVQVAQSAQAAPVPVQFNAKPDPNAIYLRIIPHTGQLNVPYGTTTFTCAFEVYTFYDKATYALADWGSGTSNSGTGTFPILNYPTKSDLSWAVPDFSWTFKAYWNSGAPGEKVWSGAKAQAQQHCVDLSIIVPNSQPAGTYTASIQYNLLVN